MPDTSAAARALALLDLTNLDEACTSADIEALCRRAVTPHGNVAAVCLWPRFVADARRRLGAAGVRIATVVNFPGGGEDTASVLAETRAALDDGADEIDLVMAYRALAAGRPGYAETQIVRVRQAMGGSGRLKVILETGELKDPALIDRAARIAIGAGADFIKTSTGKVPVNATPQAARIMLEAIRRSSRPVGLKPAGGIRTSADAATYLALADEIMGPGWAGPETFRLGASSLLDALLATLDDREPEAGGGY